MPDQRADTRRLHNGIGPIGQPLLEQVFTHGTPADIAGTDDKKSIEHGSASPLLFQAGGDQP